MGGDQPKPMFKEVTAWQGGFDSCLLCGAAVPWSSLDTEKNLHREWHENEASNIRSLNKRVDAVRGILELVQSLQRKVGMR